MHPYQKKEGDEAAFKQQQPAAGEWSLRTDVSITAQLGRKTLFVNVEFADYTFTSLRR